MTVSTLAPADPWAVSEYDFPATEPIAVQTRFLLNWAILAPSSHNTQPWQFAVDGSRIHVFADPSRWLRYADPDRRELFVSIGCAIENILVAAAYLDFEVTVHWAPDLSSHASTTGEDLIRVATLHVDADGSADVDRAELFPAIVDRHTNHEPYEDRPVPDGVLSTLEWYAGDDMRLWMTDDESIRASVYAMMARANAMQFVDREWREELAECIGEGAFGTPWLMSKIGQLAVTYLDLSDSTTAKDRERLDSAPVLAALATHADTPKAQVRAGQALERIWLAATLRGLQLQPMNQLLQIPVLKNDLRLLLPDPAMHPQITFRLGYGEPERSHTPRRSLDEVMIEPKASQMPA
ncbi:Acg family FMN-binding oxidoreductase [Longibacter salinarum]|nr:nitroreductase family protein [Longibacter salinarum]